MASWARKLALAALISATGSVATDRIASAENADDLSKGVPSKEALQRKTAMKLAGLAMFVASACPDLNLNSERFKSAMQALGVPLTDLNDQKTKFAYLAYTMSYKQDIKTNCALAKERFGPQGKTLPNLFQVAVVPPKPPSAGVAPPSAKTPSEKAPEPAKPETKKP